MRRALAAALALAVAACAHAPAGREAPREPSAAPPEAAPPPAAEAPAPAPEEAREQTGFASFYGHKFQGRRTASGERYDVHRLTCAHRTEPFGTRLRVTDLESGKSVVVRVNDRGPFSRGRIIDLSLAAARELGMVRRGLARVKLERLDAASP